MDIAGEGDRQGCSEGWPFGAGASHGKGLERSWDREEHTEVQNRHKWKAGKPPCHQKPCGVCVAGDTMCKMTSFNRGKTDNFRASPICVCFILPETGSLWLSAHPRSLQDQHIPPSITEQIITMGRFPLSILICGFLLALQLCPQKVFPSQ